MKLYYVKNQNQGYFKIEAKPYQKIGFADAKPELKKGNHLKVIIVFTHIVRRNNLQKVLQLEQPIKINLNVINPNGECDLLSTSRLYEMIYKMVKSSEIEDDDSWMYRSRPFYW